MRKTGAAVWLVLALILTAGCNRSGGSASAEPTATPLSAVPTMPSARFAQPTTMIQSAGGVTISATVTESESISETQIVTGTATDVPAPSEPTATPTAAATSASSTTGTDFTTQGMNSYANRHCGECHGAEGEGVEGKGVALAGTALSETEFADVVRTGGKGTLGSTHIFGPNAISPGALTSMYAWLSSLDE